MPRGGHLGLWKPLPKDIFRSRWKRFYKRSFRGRTGWNLMDRKPPHIQANMLEDVPSPWKFHIYQKEAIQEGSEKGGSRNAEMSSQHYGKNVLRYLMPAMRCKEGTASDVILRCLDSGRRGTASLSGFGRMEAAWGHNHQTEGRKDEQHPPATFIVPQHILEEMRPCFGNQTAAHMVLANRTSFFKVRRLMELLEEEEIVWKDGQSGQRRGAKTTQDNRGNFPYIDERAGLLDELNLADILRLRHKTNSRRHPKWKEIQFWFKKWHRSYLRRRAINIAEAKARMGVLKQVT
mmetsp:Transcript_43112/g.100475  ORF Transcript_43112/g.100475 Transcript_43112/m.100475 type:complete len:291 (-) Transcript_43112:33-905(-)